MPIGELHGSIFLINLYDDEIFDIIYDVYSKVGLLFGWALMSFSLIFFMGNVAATQIHKTRESKQEQKMAHADSVKSLHDTNSYLLSWQSKEEVKK